MENQMQNIQQEKSSRSFGAVARDVIWGLFLSFSAIVVIFWILSLSNALDTFNFYFIHLFVAAVFAGVSFGFLYAWRHSERRLTARLFYYIGGIFSWIVFFLSLTAVVASILVSFGGESNLYGGSNKAFGFEVLGFLFGLVLSPLYLWAIVFLERKILQLPFRFSRVLFWVALLLPLLALMVLVVIF